MMENGLFPRDGRSRADPKQVQTAICTKVTGERSSGSRVRIAPGLSSLPPAFPDSTCSHDTAIPRDSLEKLSSASLPTRTLDVTIHKSCHRATPYGLEQ